MQNPAHKFDVFIIKNQSEYECYMKYIVQATFYSETQVRPFPTNECAFLKTDRAKVPLLEVIVCRSSRVSTTPT